MNQGWGLPVLWHTLQWHHNVWDGISNHQLHDCLFECLFRHRSKKTSMLRITGLCEGNSPVTGEFPAQRASNAENVSIWWCHHDTIRVIRLSPNTGYILMVQDCSISSNSAMKLWQFCTYPSIYLEILRQYGLTLPVWATVYYIRTIQIPCSLMARGLFH